MQQEIRFATFNVCNLAPPGVKLYDNLLPTTPEEYEAKLNWTAHQIDLQLQVRQKVVNASIYPVFTLIAKIRPQGG